MRITTRTYDHPDSARLIEMILQDDIDRYGGADATPVDPGEFAPPQGLFLVGYVGEEAVASGGWRSLGEDAELKRMFVVETARGRGYARAILAEVERTAMEAGHHRIILETGEKNVEAIAMYRAAGYADVAPFGYYADDPLSLHLGKRLSP